jgi:hypothetical protein
MPALPAILRALLVWLLIVAAETLQGGLRRLLFDPDVEFVVRQVSVLTGALIIFAITWAFIRWLRIRSAAGALGVGLLWVSLTLAFEVVVGRALGLGWARIAADYDLLHGGLMPLGLVAMALTPWLVGRLQARRQRPLLQSLAPAMAAREEGGPANEAPRANPGDPRPSGLHQHHL